MAGFQRTLYDPRIVEILNEVSTEWVDARSVRTGEEVVVMGGEIVPVDGVVQAGEARLLPFPGATTPLLR